MTDEIGIVARQRAVQRQVQESERQRPKQKLERAMQAGARQYPEPPFPDQLLQKPGLEKDQRVAPMYDAPFWRGSGKLEGKKAIITGGDFGIGRAVAVLFAREGADVAIIHLPAEQADADATKAAVEAEGHRCWTMAGDVTDRGFCFEATQGAVEALGGLDILVNNAAFQCMSRASRTSPRSISTSR